MMGGVARVVGIALVGVVCACNAATDGGEASPEAPLPPRNREETASAPIEQKHESTSGELPGMPSDPDAGGPNLDGGSEASLLAPGDVFLDDFQRADSAAVGDGRFEKVDSFSILGGSMKQTGLGSYRDLMVRRHPAFEGLANRFKEVRDEGPTRCPCRQTAVAPLAVPLPKVTKAVGIRDAQTLQDGRESPRLALVVIGH